MGIVWILPALVMYGAFVLYPLTQSLRFSLYKWDGVGEATFVGLANYIAVFTTPESLNSIIHAFVLIFFFTVLPVSIGLIGAEVLRGLRPGPFNTLGRIVLFIPQVIPLAGAAIAWTWIYSPNGLLNQILSALGLELATRDWLGDFDTALPAVGIIGSWVVLGLCTVLLLSAMGRIDPSLYEAAQLDGANRLRQFASISVPGLRNEIVVCVTITIIAALSSFDIVYVATSGGPGYATMVPGVEIYRLLFASQQVGLASALGVVLAALVLIVILPIQRLGRDE